MSQLLNRKKILGDLSSDAIKHFNNLIILESVGSTNDYLLSKDNIPSGYICLAEQQTNGRGRRGGRGWISPPNQNIYLSLCWHFPTATPISGLGLAIGIAVIDALQNYGIDGLQIKWPNDILYRHQKMGGILIDANRMANTHYQTIIGIGLNVAMAKENGQQIEQAWTDIESIIGQTPDRNKLVSHLLNALLPMLKQFETQGLSLSKARWQQLDMLAGHEVTVQTAKGTQNGIARGIDDAGFLIVDIDGAVQHLSSGEVSIRLWQKS